MKNKRKRAVAAEFDCFACSTGLELQPQATSSSESAAMIRAAAAAAAAVAGDLMR
jgi:hypothetical protein